MRFIKKILAFILLIILTIANAGLKFASFFITRMAPGLSVLTVLFAIYVYSKAGFVADKIIPILGVAFLIATVGVILPHFIKGTVELQNEMHEYVFDFNTYSRKYKTSKRIDDDYCNDALAHKLMLTRIKD